MDTVTCGNCGVAVGEDDAIISGSCPACGGSVGRRRVYKEPDADAGKSFIKAMDDMENIKNIRLHDVFQLLDDMEECLNRVRELREKLYKEIGAAAG